MQITRTHAFAIHLGISLVIFLALLALLVFDWYRFPLFTIEGGWKAVQIIAGCDLVLGPLLTLIVYKPGKPRLKLDLSIIAAIQFTALVSGTAIVYLQRPVLLVFAEERFRSLTYDYVRIAGINPDQLDAYHNTPYPFAVVRMPDNEEDRNKLRWESAGRGGLHLRGDLYEAQNTQYLQDVQQHNVDIEKLAAGNAEALALLERFKSRHGALDRYYFIPLHARYKNVMLALHRSDGSIVDTLKVEPSRD